MLLGFYGFWLSTRLIRQGFTLQTAIGNLIGIQNFTGLGNDFNWYISAILLLYFLAPYFKKFIDKTSNMAKMVMLVFLVVISIPFWTADTYIITVCRIPIFYIGMLFATICKKNKPINRNHILILVSAFVVGLLELGISIKFLDEYLWSRGYIGILLFC